VTENQPSGTLVGTVRTTDPDGADFHTYALVSGNGDQDNARFTIDHAGNLRTAELLDNEAGSSCSIRVRSTDSGGLFTEQVFTITVSNGNEAPTVVGTRSELPVRDKSLVRPFAKTIVADPDSKAQVLTVTVEQSEPDNGKFTAASLKDSGMRAKGGGLYGYQGTAAQVKEALRRLVFNPTNNQVTPGGTVTTTFTVAVSDGSLTTKDSGTSVVATSVNDRPTAVSHRYRIAVNQVLTVPPERGLLAGASDPDGDPLQVVLVSGPAVGRLTLNPDGSFIYSPARNFQGAVVVRFRVRDVHGGLSDAKDLIIYVQASLA